MDNHYKFSYKGVEAMLKIVLRTEGEQDGLVIVTDKYEILGHFCDTRYDIYDLKYPVHYLNYIDQVPYRHRKTVIMGLKNYGKVNKVDLKLIKRNKIKPTYRCSAKFEQNNLDSFASYLNDALKECSQVNLRGKTTLDKVNALILSVEEFLQEGKIVDNPILEDKVNKAQNFLIAVRNILEL